MPDIQLKRAYAPASADDGTRMLVDRLWPRGLSKEVLQVEGWARDAAPSTDLRRWFHHQTDRWEEFRARYRAELMSHPEVLAPLLAAARHGRLTLVYGAKDAVHNHAVVLREILAEALADPK